MRYPGEGDLEYLRGGPGGVRDRRPCDDLTGLLPKGDLDRERDLDIRRGVNDLDLNLPLDLDLDRVRDLGTERLMDLDLDLILEIDLDLERDFDLTRDLDRERTLDLE